MAASAGEILENEPTTIFTARKAMYEIMVNQDHTRYWYE
jgi:hypothetical protein